MVNNKKTNNETKKKNTSLEQTKEENNNDNDNNNEQTEMPVPASTAVKSKRGRKSKKALIASLKIEAIPNNTNQSLSSIAMKIDELTTSNIKTNDSNTNTQNMLALIETIGNESYNENVIILPSPPEDIDNDFQYNADEQNNNKPLLKKRGRKPKGGKIIQQVVPNNIIKEEKQNIIIHLKCTMKDLSNPQEQIPESYSKTEYNYDIIGSEHISSFIDNNKNYEEDYDDENENFNTKDAQKNVWNKLKQLEYNLHINAMCNRKSACFWCTYDFDNPPIYIPKHFINSTYHVYGCFCSPECGVAYLMNENIDSSTKFERYHLFNHIYTKIYNYKKNIKPAPNPYYMLEKYYGNLSIQEYRSLLHNERLFLIVDKPLTRILPELHEDNDDYILNNKIIPSNTNYQLKTRLQKKKQNKNSIVNEKFGITNTLFYE